jgi:hypothetical protein
MKPPPARCWPNFRKAVCTKCGMIGADVRPNWNERLPPESLTGAQWRQR